MIGLLYMTARDREMPRQFKRLNRHGVPLYPLLIAVGLPSIVLLAATNFESLAGLYAIGVVGAITVNLGSCAMNHSDRLHVVRSRCSSASPSSFCCWVELTLAHTKPDALFFVVCVLGVGLALRAYTQKRQGLTTMTVTHAGRGDGFARSGGDHATAPAGRSENHGRGARHYLRC